MKKNINRLLIYNLNILFNIKIYTLKKTYRNSIGKNTKKDLLT